MMFISQSKQSRYWPQLSKVLGSLCKSFRILFVFLTTPCIEKFDKLAS